MFNIGYNMFVFVVKIPIMLHFTVKQTTKLVCPSNCRIQNKLKTRSVGKRG